MALISKANQSALGIAEGSIELDQIEDITDGEIVVGSAANIPTAVPLSGDVAIINSGVSTIQEGAVEDSMIEALANGEFIIGVDGTAVNNAKVTMSGDATLANDGALTVATGAIEDSMIEGLTAGQIILGVDGTAINNIKAVLSGNVSMNAAGVVTIANGVVEENMLVVPSIDALNVKRIARATYSYAEHGGAISTIGLGVTLPDNAIVTRTYYEVITTLTSNAGNDAATISFDIPVDDVAGLVAAQAISAGGDIWDAGNHEGIQDGTAAAFATKTTGARELSVTIGVEAIDAAGIVLFFCEYVVTE